jgi:hypothetical protein
MIIDVRFNGGGNIADTLIDWLERKPSTPTMCRATGIPAVGPPNAMDTAAGGA